MALPASFKEAGFISASALGKGKLRRLMISCYGPPDTGKTEFAWSAPGPIMHLGLDRGHDGTLANPKPPKTRRTDIGFNIVQLPTAQATSDRYLVYWQTFYGHLKGALANPDARTVVLDGDSDSWELQRLAEFGKLMQIPAIMYTQVNLNRRNMYARMFDSGKIIICTNKTKKVYADVLLGDGTPKLTNSGEAVREWNGEYKPQGFEDSDFVFQIRLLHYYRQETKTFGIQIMKCKQDMSLEGLTLEGPDCNFQGLVQTVFPDVPLAEWGYTD
jgi:hypothetical protein